ncbi:MAG: hypothetical protein AAFQ87_25055, partial [Bacteroidota bacterium]
MLVIVVLSVFTSCDRQTIVESEPKLRFVGLSPETIRANVDTLTLWLEYEDVEGDLGEESPESKPLSIKDSRLPEPDFYHVQPLAPIGATVWIRGTLAIKIPRLFLMSAAQTEDAFF